MAAGAPAVEDRGAAGSAPVSEPRGVTRTRVEVRLLGSFQVLVDGHVLPPVLWTRRHSAALVKLLALTPDRSLHREQVIDALWPDLGLHEAAPRLHKAAHYARKTLGHRSAILLSADTVRLCPDDDVHIDEARFRHDAGAAIADGGVAAARAALASYGGELLPQDPYEPWAEQPRLHLRRLHAELLHQAEEWHQVLAADPASESAHLALAQRYAEHGDRPAALRQLDELDRVLDHELGLRPGRRASELRQRVETPDTPSRGCCPQSERSPRPAAASVPG
jgi:DNA-binding SARP family transcriptional activator